MLFHDPKWKMRGWMHGYLNTLSIQNPTVIRKIMTSSEITYTGEKLKVEIALLERLREAGLLRAKGKAK